ncbi:hypothetical protein FBY34_4203 [Streptomyces sp. SLBN-115]|nr:hypothetical protein FBY34_4203 [Streptomyces sp. SLBN-115]
MSALLRYQTALLLRSQRWLPPFLLYAVFLGVGVQGGQPLLDSLGYTAAFLLPVAAWLVRICVGNEPPAARTVVAAAVGPGRAHLACVLVALTTAVVLGTTATAMVTLISDPVGSDHDKRVPVLEAAGAGLLARPDLRPARHGRGRAHRLARAALARSRGPRTAAGGPAGAGGERFPGAGGGERPGQRLPVGDRPRAAPAHGRGSPTERDSDSRGVHAHVTSIALRRSA